MYSFAFFIHVKLPAANGYLGCARNAQEAHPLFPLVGIFFDLHSVKCITEHNIGTDHKLSHATGLTTIYDTQNIQEKDIPYCSGNITHYNCVRLSAVIPQPALVRAVPCF